MTARNDHDQRGQQGGADGAAQDPNCRWQESLALHALGSLPALEVPGLLGHLETGCPHCAAEAARVAETLAAMDALHLGDGELLPTVDSAMRARLLAAIEREPVPAAPVAPRTSAPLEFERSWQRMQNNPGKPAGNGLSIVPGGEQGWEATPIAGIDVKLLSVDQERRCVTMLVRMAAGTSYPPHRHAAREECFVVSGAVQVGGRTLRAGDYQLAEERSLHGVQSTETGCELLIVSSQDDELV